MPLSPSGRTPFFRKEDGPGELRSLALTPYPPTVSCVPASRELVSGGPLPLPVAEGGHAPGPPSPSPIFSRQALRISSGGLRRWQRACRGGGPLGPSPPDPARTETPRPAVARRRCLSRGSCTRMHLSGRFCARDRVTIRGYEQNLHSRPIYVHDSPDDVVIN